MSERAGELGSEYKSSYDVILLMKRRLSTREHQRERERERAWSCSRKNTIDDKTLMVDIKRDKPELRR